MGWHRDSWVKLSQARFPDRSRPGSVDQFFADDGPSPASPERLVAYDLFVET